MVLTDYKNKIGPKTVSCGTPKIGISVPKKKVPILVFATTKSHTCVQRKIRFLVLESKAPLDI